MSNTEGGVGVQLVEKQWCVTSLDGLTEDSFAVGRVYCASVEPVSVESDAESCLATACANCLKSSR